MLEKDVFYRQKSSKRAEMREKMLKILRLKGLDVDYPKMSYPVNWVYRREPTITG